MITTADAVIFDAFIFDEAFDMASATRSAMRSTAAATWVLSYGAYTTIHAAPDSTTVFLEGTSQSCNTFIDALYGVNGVGTDLLYTGSFSPFAEPRAFGLLAIGVCWSCRHTSASERLEVQTIWANGGSIGEPPFLFSDPSQSANTKPVKDDGRYGREKRQADG